MSKHSELPSEAAPRVRAPIELWAFNQTLSLRRLALRIRVNQNTLQRACYPPSDPNFREANMELRRKVEIFTNGAVGVKDWPERKSDIELATKINPLPSHRRSPAGGVLPGQSPPTGQDTLSQHGARA